jgi:glycosyltransferase involved in cell wall biosynthesis
MFVSLIICTRNRAAQLQLCLNELAAATMPACDLEVVLVDNGSTDSTGDVIREFAAAAPMKVVCAERKKTGLGAARNVGIAASKGEWLLFTDDDCYVDKSFFVNFLDFANVSATSDGPAKDIRYGVGPIEPYDKDHEPRIAGLSIEKINLLPAMSLFRTGTVQGANMFVHRSVFDRVGLFNERMGAGTEFGCEDIELAARASLGGFVGAQVPFFKVIHHHKRLIGSAAAKSTLESYDYGRGAYYASLLENGISQAWRLWEEWSLTNNSQDPLIRARLVRELQGAARYLSSLS